MMAHDTCPQPLRRAVDDRTVSPPARSSTCSRPVELQEPHMLQTWK